MLCAMEKLSLLLPLPSASSTRMISWKLQASQVVIQSMMFRLAAMLRSPFFCKLAVPWANKSDGDAWRHGTAAEDAMSSLRILMALSRKKASFFVQTSWTNHVGENSQVQDNACASPAPWRGASSDNLGRNDSDTHAHAVPLTRLACQGITQRQDRPKQARPKTCRDTARTNRLSLGRTSWVAWEVRTTWGQKSGDGWGGSRFGTTPPGICFTPGSTSDNRPRKLAADTTFSETDQRKFSALPNLPPPRRRFPIARTLGGLTPICFSGVGLHLAALARHRMGTACDASSRESTHDGEAAAERGPLAQPSCSAPGFLIGAEAKPPLEPCSMLSAETTFRR